MSNPWHDVMTNDYSAYSDELVGARLLHGVYDDAMSPEVSQRPLTANWLATQLFAMPCSWRPKLWEHHSHLAQRSALALTHL